MAANPTELVARFAALPGAARLLGALADDPGSEAYAVGGSVRDLFLGRAPLDVDVAVSGGGVDALAGRLGGATVAHERFGTASVPGPEGVRYDLAATRRERYERPGALPPVSAAGIDEDLRRRDITVNAIALGLAGPRTGELVAVPDALEDLDAGVLRVLHDASFRDDPTRLLRVARYGARLGFGVEPHTAALAAEALRGGALTTVSGPRLGSELALLADEPDPVAALQALRALGIDAALAPGFGLADPTVARSAVELLADRRRDGPALVLGAALTEVTPARRRELLDAWGVDAATRTAALQAAGRAGELGLQLAEAARPSLVLAAIGSAGPATVALAGALGGAGAARTARRWAREWSTVTADVDGDDLVAAGIAPGPAIGAGLRAARAALLDGDAPDRASQLRVALEAARAQD